MDSLTQATLGAAIGELVLGRKLGNRALAWGAVFGTLPDLDIIFHPFFDTAGQLWWHRGPSHSLLVMIIASALLARPLARLWAADKVGASMAAWFVFLNWSTHVLIDCFTVYGTAVLWPFSEHRVAFNHLFIIDPLFTVPMLVAIIWCAWLRKPPQQAKRRKVNGWGLGLAAAYAAVSVGFKFVASAGFDADLIRRGLAYERRMEAPTAFNILLWRSVVEREEEFLVGYRSVFEWPSSAVRWTVYPKGHQALAAIDQMPEFQAVDHFADGWWIARHHVKGVWIADLRFGERRHWNNKKNTVDCRLAFAWDLLPAAESERLRPKPRPEASAKDTLRRLLLRALVQRDAWESTPRLEGVTGSLPESLDICE